MRINPVVHILEPDTGVRNLIKDTARALGLESKAYSSVARLCASRRRSGVVFLRDGAYGNFCEVYEALSGASQSLLIIAMGEAPPVTEVVLAMKAGAFDYLQLPVCPHHLKGFLARMADEAIKHSKGPAEMGTMGETSISARSSFARLQVSHPRAA